MKRARERVHAEGDAELCFKADREWREYDAEVPDLVRHLGER